MGEDGAFPSWNQVSKRGTASAPVRGFSVGGAGHAGSSLSGKAVRVGGEGVGQKPAPAREARQVSRVGPVPSWTRRGTAGDLG